MFPSHDRGEYLSKSQDQNKFVVGQSANYEAIPNKNPQYPAKIKPVQESFKGGQRGSNKSFALAYSKDLAVAHIGQGKDFNSEKILDVAEAFYQWLEK